MALEGDPTSGTFYINGLVATYPGGGESKSQGDDHLRLIKKAVKNTFPNIDAPVTATEDELNLLDGVTATTAELNILDGVTATTAELNILDGVTLTYSQINSLLTFGIQFTLPTGANGTYVLDQYAAFGYTINSAVYDTAVGTITAAVKIDGTDVTGLSALSLTTSEAGPTSSSGAYTVAVGNTVTVVLSSNSSATGVSIKLNCTRT